MKLKLKYSKDERDKLYEELEREVKLAEEDYIRKKVAKGEKVDNNKMRIALNYRQKIKNLTKRCLASTFSVSNILDSPSINRAVEKLERESQ